MLIILSSCKGNRSEELLKHNLPSNHVSRGKATQRPNEFAPFFEKEYKAEKVFADSTRLGQIVEAKIKPMFDDQSAKLLKSFGGDLLRRLKKGSYDPIYAELNDGFDNDEVTISIRSIVLAGDPVLTGTLDGVHTKTRARSADDVEVTQSYATLYSYNAIYRVTIQVDFDDQDGGFSNEDRSKRITVDFPVAVDRLTQWTK